MLKPEFSGQFKRDYKLAVKRGCNPKKLEKLTLPMPEGRGFLLPATRQWLTSPFLAGRSARYGYAISHHRAEHIVPYAVCLLPAYSVLLVRCIFYVPVVFPAQPYIYNSQRTKGVLRTCSCPLVFRHYGLKKVYQKTKFLAREKSALYPHS